MMNNASNSRMLSPHMEQVACMVHPIPSGYASGKTTSPASIRSLQRAQMSKQTMTRSTHLTDSSIRTSDLCRLPVIKSSVLETQHFSCTDREVVSMWVVRAQILILRHSRPTPVRFCHKPLLLRALCDWWTRKLTRFADLQHWLSCFFTLCMAYFPVFRLDVAFDLSVSVS